MEGTVLYGISNIYTVESRQQQFECRIKGKILGNSSNAYRGGEYNPLAPGDRVEFEQDPIEPGKGWITRRCNRTSCLNRWNKKRNALQTVAANIDVVVCITSPERPPFRPRFIDRLSVLSQNENVPLVICMNKSDLPIHASVGERMENYDEIGFTTHFCSAKTGEGIAELEELLRGSVSVLVGQSGVGKSSILNRIEPGLNLRIADISRKYNRGAHTTVYAGMIQVKEDITVIDTPGIRELDILHLSSDQLQFLFPEMVPHIGSCAYSPCTHTHEPDCEIKNRVTAGAIHPDRYESYLRMYTYLRSEEKEQYG
jgi:ribosome biogenesis GTPase